jgi:DNA-binding LacI/PurR family transcriptional regulator
MFPIGFTTQARPGVWLDLAYAIQRGVSHLADHNRHQICFFAPSGKTESPSVKIRQKIFLDECDRQNLPPPVCLSYPGESWDVEAAIAGIRGFLSRNTGTEAYFCFNDVAALGVLLSIADVEQKPVVICFDGTRLVRHWPRHPPVFDLKISKLAQMAVDVAIGKQSLNKLGRKMNWLKPQLII